MGENVFLNGNIVDINDAVIPVTDRGFLYGDGIFETMRVYEGFPFQLSAHIKRLTSSARGLSIDTSPFATLEEDVKRLIRSNDLKNGVLRITVTRGTSKERSLVEEGLKPNVVIQTHDLPEIPESYYKRGVSVVTIEDNRNEICNFKNTNLLPGLMAKHHALKNRSFESIMVSKRGFITEGSSSNVFGVIDGNLLTPPAGKKVLNGITRQVVIRIAQELGIRVDEDGLMGNELAIVSELFVTNSVVEILPVTVADNKVIGEGRVGQITSKLIESFNRVTNNWLKAQKEKV